MQFTGHMLAAAAGADRERNRGAETITTLCGGPPDSKGLANGAGRSARAREGAFKRNLRGREGVNLPYPFNRGIYSL